jgi:cytochrome c oxidase subunit 2
MALTGRLLAVIAALTLAGCDGVQSSLAPQGPEAARVFMLFVVLTAGSAVILLGVIAFTVVAMFGRERWRERLGNETLVIGFGLVFPVVTLAVLLVYGLTLIGAAAHPPAPGAPLRVSVVGEQWWWRVIYRDGDGRRIESANELRIPVDRPVEIELTTADVIHSFWVPKLAGKLDMIPGRTTRLRLAATTPGVSRGQCAEYCGGAHALMAFYVVALPQAEFDRWLMQEAGPAAAAADSEARAGEMLFLSHGCGACHTVRGSAAVGTIGPDLTHVGSRMSLAAAVLPNDAPAFARWIADNQHIKPQNRMPPFRIFSEAELRALSVYLANLK